MVILLLLGAGFLYIVKNPALPISQKILTTLWIDMTANTEWTWVDLTNCINYFDGCNTCSVVSGKVEACTKMYCETPAEPQCLEYANTGIDLTNCISYFDGCNNCSVKDGQPDACTLMYCETPGQPKCNEYATWTENTEITGDTQTPIDEPGISSGSEWEWTACNMIYAPVCASVAIQCIKAPCNPVQQTFSNRCVMEQNKLATFVHDGECGSVNK